MTSILRRVALVLGIVIAMVVTWIRRIDNSHHTRLVVVAARDIGENEVIDDASVIVARLPADAAPTDAFQTKGGVVGQAAQVAIRRGDALRYSRVGFRRPYPYQLRAQFGKRLMSLRIVDAAGTEMISRDRRNSHADVMVVIEAGKKGRVAKLVAQNVAVLRVEPMPRNAATGATSLDAVATVEVTPNDAERLAIASAQGQMRLLLRGFGDQGFYPGTGTTELTLDTSAVSFLPVSPATSGLRIVRPPPQRDTIVRDLLRRSNVQQKFLTDSARRSP